ncbi:MAG: hypothetical protein ACOCZ8_01015 [Bacteroidota bacterium]
MNEQIGKDASIRFTDFILSTIGAHAEEKVALKRPLREKNLVNILYQEGSFYGKRFSETQNSLYKS